MLLGDRDAGPAELGQLAQLGPKPVVGRSGLGRGAHGLPSGARGEQLARGALDVLLVLGEPEVHGYAEAFSRGRPSTRSATMFLSTSVVPPSIELPRARRSS